MQSSSVHVEAPPPTETLKVQKLPHLAELNGLRAIAVGIVFFGHASIVSKFPGGFGVTIFFFLSGFLITTLMRLERNRSGTVNLKGFYLRRLLRIQPPLLISMAAIGALILTGVLQHETAGFQVVGQLLLVTNYLPSFGKDGGLPIPLWSLAVEEHFYLVFPLLYIALSRRLDSRRIAYCSLALCVVVLAIRLFNVLALNNAEGNYYYSHTRVDSILFGCVLALWGNPVTEAKAWKPGRLWLAAAVLVILGTFVTPTTIFREGVRYTLQGAALLVTFSWALQHKGIASRVLTSPPMQLLGQYSYTIYLVHYALLLLVEQHMPDTPALARAIVAGMLSVCSGFAMHRLVEAPLGRLRQQMNRPQKTAARVEDDEAVTALPATN